MLGLDSWKNKTIQVLPTVRGDICHTLPRVGLSKMLESNQLPWVFLIYSIGTDP